MARRFMQFSLLIGTIFNLSSVFAHYQPIQSSPHKKLQVDTILVEKQKHKMTLYHNNRPIKTYNIALGFNPEGHKEQEGDGKTPEGVYYITGKNPQSRFHLSLKLSYPSINDQNKAQRKGINPGSNIMIHGLGPRFHSKGKWHALKDWTLGCIAVTNDEIEEIFHYADVGTKVEILP
ncbi:MAG: L,D-transpeptidase family protein [Gammaproteobacteria bacterium]|nr:L,D-transpeptidase family protein [Gammaproteobacteria bacterium]